ncbi:hypothetical protein BSKO_02084 [Bryopsis sp. KO-2023]|nr:hypothetical protein BSKO_02084 [Bryopsis sp. KO-2023]
MEMASKTDIPWDELLDDLFQGVINKLQGRHVAPVRSVCSSWKYKAQRLLEKITFDIGRQVTVSRLVDLFPALVDVKLVFHGQEPQLCRLGVLASLGRLEHLELEQVSSTGQPPLVDLGVLGGIRRLRALVLRGCRFTSSAGLQQVSQLREVRFSRCMMDVREPTLAKILQPLRKLQALRVEECLSGSRVSLRGVGCLTTLEALCLRIPDAACDEFCREVVKLTRLTRLDMNVAASAELSSISDLGVANIASMRSLKDISLAGHFGISNRGVEALSMLDSVTALDLSIPGPLSEFLMEELELHDSLVDDSGLRHLLELRHLKSLTISYTMISHRLVCQFLSSFLMLEHLNVSHCPNIIDATCFAFDVSPRLTSLNASFCNISDLGLLGLSRSAPGLKALDISGCHPSISDLGLRQLCKLTNLRCLSLGHCEGITDDGLRDFVSSVSQTEYLSLKGCTNVTDEGIAVVARNLVGLRELVLVYCYQLSDASAFVLKDMAKLENVRLSHGVLSNNVCRMLAENGIEINLSRQWWV